MQYLTVYKYQTDVDRKLKSLNLEDWISNVVELRICKPPSNDPKILRAWDEERKAVLDYIVELLPEGFDLPEESCRDMMPRQFLKAIIQGMRVSDTQKPANQRLQ